jgi:hypothetical protein
MKTTETREPKCAEVVRARVGRKMLIVAYVRKKNGAKLYWFYVGQVVADQLRNTRLPVWAQMEMIEGTDHPFFYRLTLAQTTNVQRLDKLSGNAPLQLFKSKPKKPLCKPQPS